MSCDYPDCPWQAEHEQSDDPTKCVFHAKIGKKRIGDDEFWTQLSRRMMGGNSNFTGFIFPPITRQFPQPFKPNIRFDRATFEGDGKTCADFTGIKFLDVSFVDAVFKNGIVKFKNSEFTGMASFDSATFECAKAVFDNTTFHRSASFEGAGFLTGISMIDVTFEDSSVGFLSAVIKGREARFQNVQFKGGAAEFGCVRFECDWTLFKDVSFEGGSADFEETKFSGVKVEFTRCRFHRDAHFHNNEIAGELLFEDVHFAETTKFHFGNPIFSLSSKKPACVKFRRINFNPFNTFFEDIRAPEATDKAKNPIPVAMIFRHCNLKDVYFSNNDMSLFSFFKSYYFEQAHYTSVNWDHRYEQVLFGIKFKRRNLIFEEIYLDKILNNKVPDEWDLEDLDKHWKVAELYRKMKTALDLAKDYHMASWFYFNEFEMKRQYNIEKNKQNVLKRIFSPRRWTFSAYRLFAGYGEKPFWSFIWFWIFAFAFSVLHLFNGVPIDKDRSFHYEIVWVFPPQFPNVGQLLNDFGSAFALTLYRVLPTNYLPFDKSNMLLKSLSLPDVLLSLANIFVLALLIVFTAIGLKRRFRRF